MSTVCFDMKETKQVTTARVIGKHRINNQESLHPLNHHFAQIIEAALGDHVLETLDYFRKTLQNFVRRRLSLVAAATIAAISRRGLSQHFPNEIGDGSLQRGKPKYLPRSNLQQGGGYDKRYQYRNTLKPSSLRSWRMTAETRKRNWQSWS